MLKDISLRVLNILRKITAKYISLFKMFITFDTLIIFDNSRIRLSTEIYACDIDDYIFYSTSNIIVITRVSVSKVV